MSAAAIHEAAHALVLHNLRIPIKYVWLKRELMRDFGVVLQGETAGRVQVTREAYHKPVHPLAFLRIHLAGPIAEDLARRKGILIANPPPDYEGDASDDYSKMKEFGPEIIIMAARMDTHLLTKDWSTVMRIAETLDAKGFIRGRDLPKLVRR